MKEKASEVVSLVDFNIHPHPHLDLPPESNFLGLGIHTDILRNQARYKSVSDETGVPWYVIAVIHGFAKFECSLKRLCLQFLTPKRLRFC